MKETKRAKARRQALLEYIGSYQASHRGRTPSVERMAKIIKVRATSTVRFHLNRMTMDGMIKQVSSHPLQLKILPPFGQVELPFKEEPTLADPPETEIVETASGDCILATEPEPDASNDEEFKEEFDKLAEDREGEHAPHVTPAIIRGWLDSASVGELVSELVERGYSVAIKK